MANGNAFDDAVALAHANPALDVGCHFVLVGGQSLLYPDRALPRTVAQLLQAIALRRIDPYAELRPQVERILTAGLRPVHADTHKHTHLFPPVLDAVARLSEEFKIPWIRRPFDFPLSGTGQVPWAKRTIGSSLRGMRQVFHRKLSKHGCRTTDHFAGFQITGRFRTKELVALIGMLPDGVTELMTHPGFCTEELLSSSTRLKQSREEELRALLSAEARQALANNEIVLTRYRDL